MCIDQFTFLQIPVFGGISLPLIVAFIIVQQEDDTTLMSQWTVPAASTRDKSKSVYKEAHVLPGQNVRYCRIR